MEKKSIKKEIWKNITDYPDYQVSNYGRVKSLKFDKERYLKYGIDDRGYHHCVLYKNGKGKKHKAHLLVWDHFGDKPRNGRILQVDHIKENDKTNNRIDNLQLLNSRNNKNKSIDKNNTSSKYVGVSWHKPTGKWMSRINIKDKQIYLGLFDDEYDAHLAYQERLEQTKKGE